jgi:hypothetical protein
LPHGLPLPASLCQARKWANGEFSQSLPSRPLCWACGPIAARRCQRAIRTAITSLATKPSIGVCGYLRPLGCASVREFRNCSGRSSHSRESLRCHCQIALFRNSANAATSSFAIAERTTGAQTTIDERQVCASSRASCPSVQAKTDERNRLILLVAGRPVAPTPPARQINARRSQDARVEAQPTDPMIIR